MTGWRERRATVGDAAVEVGVAKRRRKAGRKKLEVVQGGGGAQR